MPIIRDIPLDLEINDVLRRQGIRGHSRLKDQTETSIHELIASARNDGLLQPAISYEIYAIANVDRHRLYLQNNIELNGPLFSSVLSSARELAVAVGTIGPRLEERVKDYFARNEPLKGVLLDGIGSAAVDSLARETCQLMMHEASARGYQSGSPLGPGMSGFPIWEQKQVLKLASAEEIGVSLTSAGVMHPLKSVSMVIGMGPTMKTWTQAEVCARCRLRKTCHYRVHV